MSSLKKPKTFIDFEKLVRDLLSTHFGLEFSMLGRPGQSQDGIDLYGRIPDESTWNEPIQNLHLSSESAGKHIVIQCKKYDSTKLTLKRIENDYNKAINVYDFDVVVFIVVTTSPRDAKLQKNIEGKKNNGDLQLLSKIIFWEDLCEIYEKHDLGKDVDFLIDPSILHPLQQYLGKDIDQGRNPMWFHRPFPKWIDYEAGFVSPRSDEVDELDNNFKNSNIQLLFGESGSGKTTLATLLGKRWLDRNQVDEVVYCDLNEFSVSIIESNIQNLLDRSQGFRKCLIIVDNIHLDEDIGRWLFDKRTLLKQKNTCLLMVSRCKEEPCPLGLVRLFSHILNEEIENLLVLSGPAKYETLDWERIQGILPTLPLRKRNFNITLGAILTDFLRTKGISVSASSEQSLIWVLARKCKHTIWLLSFVLNALNRVEISEGLSEKIIEDIDIEEEFRRYYDQVFDRISKAERFAINQELVGKRILKDIFHYILLALASINQMEIAVSPDYITQIFTENSIGGNDARRVVNFLENQLEKMGETVIGPKGISFPHITLASNMLYYYEKEHIQLTRKYQTDAFTFDSLCIGLLRFLDSEGLPSVLDRILDFSMYRKKEISNLLDWLSNKTGAIHVASLMNKYYWFSRYVSKLGIVLKSKDVVQEVCDLLNGLNPSVRLLSNLEYFGKDNLNDTKVLSSIQTALQNHRNVLAAFRAIRYNSILLSNVGIRATLADLMRTESNSNDLLEEILSVDLLRQSSEIHYAISCRIQNANNLLQLISRLNMHEDVVMVDVVRQSIMSHAESIALEVNQSTTPWLEYLKMNKLEYLINENEVRVAFKQHQECIEEAILKGLIQIDTISEMISTEYLANSPHIQSAIGERIRYLEDPWPLVSIVISSSPLIKSLTIQNTITELFSKSFPPWWIISQIAENSDVGKNEAIQNAIADLISKSDNPLDLLREIRDAPELLANKNVKTAIDSSISAIIRDIVISENLEVLLSNLDALNTILAEKTLKSVLVEVIRQSNSSSDIIEAIRVCYGKLFDDIVSDTEKKIDGENETRRK